MQWIQKSHFSDREVGFFCFPTLLNPSQLNKNGQVSQDKFHCCFASQINKKKRFNGIKIEQGRSWFKLIKNEFNDLRSQFVTSKQILSSIDWSRNREDITICDIHMVEKVSGLEF